MVDKWTYETRLCTLNSFLSSLVFLSFVLAVNQRRKGKAYPSGVQGDKIRQSTTSISFFRSFFLSFIRSYSNGVREGGLSHTQCMRENMLKRSAGRWHLSSFLAFFKC